VVTLFVLFAAAVAAYAYDSSKSDEIARGVSIGDVDVSGLTDDEARDLLRASLVEPLRKPVTVRSEGIRYVLKADKLGIEADIEGMVDDALAASRDGGLPVRIWRYATGEELGERIPPRISYDEEALDEFIGEVAAEVSRPPQDATIEPAPGSLSPVPAREGLELQVDELRQQLEYAVQDPDTRVIRATVETVEPEVTTDELAEQYPVYLTVDRSNFQLSLWNNLELTKTYPIAVGAVGWDTPAGLYSVQNKAVDPAWSVPEWGGELAGQVIPGGAPNNPLRERWLGIYDGAGIHGTYDTGSLGTAASHGCIRMSIPDVIDLYDRVPVGAPVYIG
jgi:lipoprotein-anchoring transpeptidase ErfK/SrfK